MVFTLSAPMAAEAARKTARASWACSVTVRSRVARNSFRPIRTPSSLAMKWSPECPISYMNRTPRARGSVACFNRLGLLLGQQDGLGFLFRKQDPAAEAHPIRLRTAFRYLHRAILELGNF